MVASHVKQPARRVWNSEIEEEEDVIPDVVPASNMKNCPVQLWTDLRRLNPYRFA
jgi:hypothetical protein